MTDQDQQPDQQQQASAFFEETFLPGFYGVIPVPAQAGEPPRVQLMMFAGPLAPGLFVAARRATLDPDTAIGMGEALVKHGREVKSGLIMADGAGAEALRA